MLDRRQSARDKVVYGGIAESGQAGPASECTVRDISETGAGLEFSKTEKLPKEQISPTIVRKGQSFLASIVSWRDNFVGVAFGSERPFELPRSDLARRLRNSQKKKRQLQRRINRLLGED
jgi:hypothetical protein